MKDFEFLKIIINLIKTYEPCMRKNSKKIEALIRKILIDESF